MRWASSGGARRACASAIDPRWSFGVCGSDTQKVGEPRRGARADTGTGPVDTTGYSCIGDGRCRRCPLRYLVCHTCVTHTTTSKLPDDRRTTAVRRVSRTAVGAERLSERDTGLAGSRRRAHGTVPSHTARTRPRDSRHASRGRTDRDILIGALTAARETRPPRSFALPFVPPEGASTGRRVYICRCRSCSCRRCCCWRP